MNVATMHSWPKNASCSSLQAVSLLYLVFRGPVAAALAVALQTRNLNKFGNFRFGVHLQFGTDYAFQGHEVHHVLLALPAPVQPTEKRR